MRLPELPSWVDDWSQKTARNVFPDPTFDAGVRQKEGVLEIAMSLDRKLLKVKAQVVGEITQFVLPGPFYWEERRKAKN